MLTVAGLHVPAIPLIEVVGKTGATAPEQMGSGASNAGVMFGLTVMSNVVVVAHCPASGVNVYVPLVVLLTVAGVQVPVIPLREVAGKTGDAEPEQIGAIALNVGTTLGLTVMFKVVVDAH